MDLEQVCASFLAHCSNERGLAANTIAAYAQDLREFAAYFRKSTVARVTGERLVEFVTHLSGTRGLAAATVKRRVACLKTMFAWLLRRRSIRSNPFATVEIRIRLPHRLPRCIAATDMSALAAASHRLCDLTRLSTLLLFATGVRVAELTSIKLADVDAAEGAIRIRGKGDRERVVYVADKETRVLLYEYMRTRRSDAPGTEPLLRGASRSPVSSASIRARLRRLSVHAGLSFRVTPHMLRHTTATSLIEAGVDIRFVQRLLGHSSIATTQIYTHVSNGALRAAMVRADSVRRFLSMAPCHP